MEWLLKYSQIYDFFSKQDNTLFDKYFDDFLKALYKHTLMVDSELFEEMRRRFAIRILGVEGKSN